MVLVPIKKKDLPDDRPRNSIGQLVSVMSFGDKQWLNWLERELKFATREGR